ncbi:hypothetical protein ACFU5Y_05905 [Streptomyces gardneri]|uniref:hypothetical protein n=1 Tax=Streptomyces gardneri TaxID=66892 RepID=UPI0036A993B5
MDGVPLWWTVVAFIGGILATQLNAFLDLRGRRTERRAVSQEELRRRREEFELQHLVEVNQLVRSLEERAGVFVSEKWLRHPARALQEDEEKVLHRVDTALREFWSADDALSAQVGFVLDDQVRALVQAAAERIRDRVHTLNDNDPVAFEEELHNPEPFLIGPYTDLPETNAAVNAAYEVISARVRELYADRPVH